MFILNRYHNFCYCLICVCISSQASGNFFCLSFSKYRIKHFHRYFLIGSPQALEGVCFYLSVQHQVNSPNFCANWSHIIFPCASDQNIKHVISPFYDIYTIQVFIKCRRKQPHISRDIRLDLIQMPSKPSLIYQMGPSSHTDTFL